MSKKREFFQFVVNVFNLGDYSVLVISKEQMDVFSKQMVNNFVNKMVKHLNNFFPEKCKILGKENTVRCIEEGIDKARKFDIVSERGICKYINLMFILGKGFHQDTSLLWASEILNNQKYPAYFKLDYLYKKAFDHTGNIMLRTS